MLFAFSGYGFNKSHSAAYAIPAYHTIWLKANHPAEFLAANCTNDMNDTDRLAQLIHEAREMGIEVLPPDVNLSQKVFTVENGKIVFGLLGIKNVGSGAVDAIVAERQAHGPFASFIDFFDRIDSHEVNRKVAESLIITGAFDRLGETRATLMHNLARVMELSAKTREAKRYGQVSLFDGAAEAPTAAVELERQPEFPAYAASRGGEGQPWVLLLGPSAGCLAGSHRAYRECRPFEKRGPLQRARLHPGRDAQRGSGDPHEERTGHGIRPAGGPQRIDRAHHILGRLREQEGAHRQ